MQRRVAFIIVVVLVVAGLLLWRRSAGRSTTAPREPSVAADAAPASAAKDLVQAAGAPAAEPGAAEAPAPLDALDCTAPQGDVASIDGEGIPAAELCAEWRHLAGPIERGDPVVMDKQGKALLEQMIDARLVQRALAAANRNVSEREVDTALDALIAARPKAAPGENPRQAFEQELQRRGNDLQHVRAELRQRLAVRTLLELRGSQPPTDDEVAAAYAADPTLFGTPKSAVIEGYLARAVPSAPADVRARALATAQTFAAEVTSGSPRDPVAIATAQGLSRMPQFSVTSGGVEPQLAAAAFDLTVGTWSQPVQTRAGWVVLRLVKIEPGRAPPLAEVRDQIRQRLVNQRKTTDQQQLLAALRAAAKIVYLQW